MKSYTSIQSKKQYKITQIEFDKSLVAFIATTSTGEVVGRLSFKIRENNIIRFQDAVVDPLYRKKGIYRDLFEERKKYIEQHFPHYKLEAYCRDTTLDNFLNDGFEIVAKMYLVEK